jgi:hypothetical protein
MPVFGRTSANTTVPRHSPNTDTTSDSPLFGEASLGDDLIWGAEGLARELGINRRRGCYLLEKKLVPARKLGALWVISRNALRRHLGSGP